MRVLYCSAISFVKAPVIRFVKLSSCNYGSMEACQWMNTSIVTATWLCFMYVSEGRTRGKTRLSRRRGG
jgi:hypothetical protein